MLLGDSPDPAALDNDPREAHIRDGNSGFPPLQGGGVKERVLGCLRGRRLKRRKSIENIHFQGDYLLSTLPDREPEAPFNDPTGIAGVAVFAPRQSGCTVREDAPPGPR